MSKVLVRFFWDYGRMGEVDGLFVTTKEELEKAYGKRVYFGEILGKYSEVYGTLDQEDIEVLSEDQIFIDQLTQLLGDHLSGYNPLDNLEEGQDEEE